MATIEHGRKPVTRHDQRERLYNARTRAELRGVVFRYVANGMTPQRVQQELAVDYEFHQGAFTTPANLILGREIKIAEKAKAGTQKKDDGKPGEAEPLHYTLQQLIDLENQTAIDISAQLRIPRVVFPRVA